MDTKELLEIIEIQKKIIDKLEEREFISKSIIEKYEKLILLHESRMKAIVFSNSLNWFLFPDFN